MRERARERSEQACARNIVAPSGNAGQAGLCAKCSSAAVSNAEKGVVPGHIQTSEIKEHPFGPQRALLRAIVQVARTSTDTVLHCARYGALYALIIKFRRYQE